MASEYNLIAAFELTNVARSAFYPSFTITANGGLQSLSFEDLFSGKSIFAALGGGLLQPVLSGRRIRTQYEVSLAEQETAALDYQFTLLNAGREVSDALYSFEAATDKIEVKEQEFEAYSQATTFSEQLLENGFANYLEVLRARENALNSSLDIVRAQNSRLQAIVDLYAALGGGWQ
jgi:outer membrane protein TolC